MRTVGLIVGAAALLAAASVPAHQRLTQAAAPQLSVRVFLSPDPMPLDAPDAALTVATAPLAECAAGVTYDDGQRPPSWPEIEVKIADLAGRARWTWHHHSRATGTAAVLCIGGARTGAAQARFGGAGARARAQATPTILPVPPTPLPGPPTRAPADAPGAGRDV